jgi:thymidylate synthase
MWWDEWDIGDGTIGQRYGATVKKCLLNTLLDGLKNDPFREDILLICYKNPT